MHFGISFLILISVFPQIGCASESDLLFNLRRLHHFCVHGEHSELVKEILEETPKLATVNARDDESLPAQFLPENAVIQLVNAGRHYPSYSGYPDSEERLLILQHYLCAGFDPNTVTAPLYPNRLLHEAAEFSGPEIVSVLLKAGADPFPGSDHKSVFTGAFSNKTYSSKESSEYKSLHRVDPIDICAALIEGGAPINILSEIKSGVSPLDIAFTTEGFGQKELDFLLSRGAKRGSDLLRCPRYRLFASLVDNNEFTGWPLSAVYKVAYAYMEDQPDDWGRSDDLKSKLVLFRNFDREYLKKQIGTYSEDDLRQLMWSYNYQYNGNYEILLNVQLDLFKAVGNVWEKFRYTSLIFEFVAGFKGIETKGIEFEWYFDPMSPSEIGREFDIGFYKWFFSSCANLNISVKLWPSIFVEIIKHPIPEISYQSDYCRHFAFHLKRWKDGYLKNQYPQRLVDNLSYNPRHVPVSFTPEAQPEKQKVFFFDIDYTLSTSKKVSDPADCETGVFESVAGSIAWLAHVRDSQFASFALMFIIPEFRELLVYLIQEQGCLVGLYSAEDAVRNEPFARDIFTHIFGEKTYRDLQEQGHFKVFSRHHMEDGDVKNFTQILQDNYPGVQLSNCVVTDDMPIKEEDRRINLDLQTNYRLFSESSAFHIGLLQEIFTNEGNESPRDIFFRLKKEECFLIRNGSKVIEEIKATESKLDVVE